MLLTYYYDNMCMLPEIFNTKRSSEVSKDFQQNPTPITAIRQLSQVA